MKREPKGNYYQIGEVSKICNIPIRTLHYYDEIGLLKPSIIDEPSKYRYYSPEQIPAIFIIKNYKTAGFTLKQIKKLLLRDDMDYVQSMIKMQCAVIDQRILELSLIKEGLRLLAHQKDSSTIADTEMKLKDFPLSYVVYKRYRSPCSKENFYIRYAELCNMIEAHKLHILGPMMAVYYEAYENPNYENMDFEVCVTVAEQAEIDGIVRKFGDFTALSAIHYGSYANIPATCIKMFKWMSDNNYVPYGPYIERYVVDISSTINENNYITELIRPVKINA
ncbi:MAG: MerR family transcriptional regulator [Bacillota bacterium]